ncbi:hypothetical protein CEXT_124171 [Caerostris extrusa]|uniref:Uncharacterized protein n=1 Tax=Caerostris extrusa TaxID=172846 RepID=A0AAV4MLG9_CAEEX|nr:hypothetical protein CEXT_124171 [Caerostris extrusa]
MALLTVDRLGVRVNGSENGRLGVLVAYAGGGSFLHAGHGAVGAAVVVGGGGGGAGCRAAGLRAALLGLLLLVQPLLLAELGASVLEPHLHTYVRKMT